MRHNYNSFEYWENIVSENKTIRGHMFMQDPPRDKSLYIHTLIFSKNNGIDNIYAYFPSEKVLLGYIQYSFLQEAFYKWIYGKDRMVTKIPSIPVTKIIKDGLNRGKINNDEANKMLKYYMKLTKMWELPKGRIVPELLKFAREFNREWQGDSKEFLYIKIFKTPEDLGEFVLSSTMITHEEDEFKSKSGVSIKEWKEICSNAINKKDVGEKFRDILQKSLSEVI